MPAVSFLPANRDEVSAVRYASLPVVTNSSAAAQYCSSEMSLSSYGPPPLTTFDANRAGLRAAATHARSAAARQRLANAASMSANTRAAWAATAARLSVAAVLGGWR